MPWWSWVLIWGVLVLALLALFALFAVLLFRKAVAVADELALVVDRLQLPNPAAVNHAAADHAAGQRPQIAILQKRSELRERRDLVRARSAERRSRNQAARLDRAHRITRLDATTREWFPHN